LKYTDAVRRQIEQELKENGFRVAELSIDVGDYRRYVEAARVYVSAEHYGGRQGATFPKKSLEHYLAAQLLELTPADVYIDVASMASPAPAIYHDLYGCRTYRQDLSYPPGLQGDRIGGDAAALPVPDGFASKMGLHCSFEHFEGDSDTGFIREASRVLRPGGKVCIVPLYLFSHYAILTDPGVVAPGSVAFAPDAVLYCQKGFGNRYGRLYDVAHLRRRIVTALHGLDLTIYSVANARDVDPSGAVKFVALLSKPD
jgi:hypothetical protein